MSDARRVLVLVHGWASAPGVFAPVEALLARRFHLIRVAMPGYGDGDADSPCDVDTLAARLRAVTPANASWLAWSTGALPALALSTGPAPHVGALNLVAPVVRFEASDDWPHGARAGVIDAFRAALRSRADGLVRRFARMVMYPDVGRDRATAFARDVERAAIEPAALAAGLELLARADMRSRLADVSVPVTLIHGERDAVVPVASSHYAAGRLPDARLCRMPGAGHAPFITHVPDFIEQFESHGRH